MIILASKFIMNGGIGLKKVFCKEHRKGLAHFLRDHDPNTQWNGSRIAKNLEEIKKCPCPRCKSVTILVNEIIKNLENNHNSN